MGEKVLFHYNAQAFCSSIGADDHVVRKSDANLFRQGQWLNDTCIGLGLRWLAEERLSLQYDLCETITSVTGTHVRRTPNRLYFVDPSAVSYLTIQCTDDDELLQANRELQLETRQLVLFPINDSIAFFQGSTHWSLLILRLGPVPAPSAEAPGAAEVVPAADESAAFQCRQLSFHAYDSSAHANAAAARATAAKVLRLLQLLGVAATGATVPVALEPSAQQTNGCDCGVHVLLEAERIAVAFMKNVSGADQTGHGATAVGADPPPSPSSKRRQLLALCERCSTVRTILNAKPSHSSDGRVTPPGEGRRAMGTRVPFNAESGMTVIGQDDMSSTPAAMAGAMPSRRLPRATFMAGRRQTSIQQRKTVMALRRGMPGGAFNGSTSAPRARSTRFAPAANMVTYMEEDEDEDDDDEEEGGLGARERWGDDAFGDGVDDASGTEGVICASATKNQQRSRMQTFALGSQHKRRTHAMTSIGGGIPDVARASLDRDVDAEVQKKSLEYVTVPKKRQTMLAGGPGGTGSIPGGAYGSASGGWQHPENKHSLVDEIRAYYLPDGMQESNEVMHRDMYTDKNLLLREAIKYDPQTLGVLAEIWAVVDTDGNGKVDHDEYVTMSKKLYQVFVGPDNEAAEREAEKDWSRDSFGYDHLDRTRFAQAWFQLADIWTDEIDCAAYVEFLRVVLDCFTQLNEDGTRVYSGDGEVESYEEVRRRHQARRKPDGARKQRRVTAIISPQRAQRKRMHVFNKKFRVSGDRKRGLLWDPKVRRHKHGDEPPAPAYSHSSPSDRSHGALWEPKERRRKHIFAKDGSPMAANAAGSTGGSTNSTLDITAGVQGKGHGGRGMPAGSAGDAPQQASPQSKRQLLARREARMRARKERKERVVARRQRKRGYKALNKLYRGMNSDRSKLVAKVHGMVKEIIASSSSSVEGMLAISSCGIPSGKVATDGTGGRTANGNNTKNGHSADVVIVEGPEKLRQKSKEVQQELVQSGLTTTEANDVLGLIGQQLLSASSQSQPNDGAGMGEDSSSGVTDAAIGSSLADLIDSAQQLDADGACEDESDEDDNDDDRGSGDSDDGDDGGNELALSGNAAIRGGEHTTFDDKGRPQAQSPSGGHSRTLSDGSRRAQPLSYDNRRVGGYQPSGTTPSHRRGASGASTVGGVSAGVSAPGDSGHAFVQQTQLDWVSNIAAPAPSIPPPQQDSSAGSRRHHDRDRAHGRDTGVKMAPHSKFDWMDFATTGRADDSNGGGDVIRNAAAGAITKSTSRALSGAAHPKEGTNGRRIGSGIIRLRRDAPARALGSPHTQTVAAARTRAKPKTRRARARMQQALPSNNFLSVNMLKPTPTLDPTLTPAPALAPTLSRASAPMAETEVAQAPALMPTAPQDDREAVGDEDGHDSHTGPADDHNDQEQSGLFAPPFVALHRIDPPSPPHGYGQRGRALTRVADAQINVAELAVTDSDSSLLASEERQQLLQDALPGAGMNSIATSQFHFDAAMPIPLPSTQHYRPHSIERPLHDSLQHGTVPRRHKATSLRNAGSRLASLGLKEFRVPVGQVPRLIRPAHLEVPKLRTVKDEVAGPIKFQDYLARLELQKAAEHKMARWPNQRRVRRF